MTNSARFPLEYRSGRGIKSMNKFLTSSALALALVMSASTAQGADLDYERTLELVVSGQVESWTGYMFYGNDLEILIQTKGLISGSLARVDA